MSSGATPDNASPIPMDLTGEKNIITATRGLNTPTVDSSAVQTTTSTDVARIALSFLLVGILAVVVILPVVAVSTNRSAEASLEALLKVILSPIIGLVGSVVGFYFGAKAAGGSTPS
jgi:hypothetical protein